MKEKKLWLLTGSSLNAENHVGQPAQVAVTEIAIVDAPHTVSAAPISVSFYRFPVAGQEQ